MIPGRMVHRLATRICSERSLDRIVEPAIADLQKEYAGAGSASRRAWILFAGYAATLKVIARCAVSVASTGDERHAVIRIMAWSLTLTVAATGLLLLPPLHGHPSFRDWNIATTLVPQAVALAIPLGVAFGIAFGLRARPTMNISKLMLVCALAASVLNFGVLAWAMPAANQAFREMIFRELETNAYQGDVRVLQKGYNEMTLSELRSQEAYFSADGEPRRARAFAFAVHRRFSLAAATFALVSVLLAAPVNHRGLRGLLALSTCFVYWMLMFVGELGSRRGYLTIPVGAWLPNLALIATAMLVASSRSPGFPAER